MFVRSFARSFARPLVRPFVCSLVRSFVHWFVHSYIYRTHTHHHHPTHPKYPKNEEQEEYCCALAVVETCCSSSSSFNGSVDANCSGSTKHRAHETAVEQPSETTVEAAIIVTAMQGKGIITAINNYKCSMAIRPRAGTKVKEKRER